ncbi:MAG: peptidase M19 [Proteobacteria bacterium]|nr:peptidase M19 [Pseudomonadota bacterium]
MLSNLLILLGIFIFPRVVSAAPVPGYADLHNHLFAEYAFGGAWIHGTVEGGLAEALSPCEAHLDPFSISGDHAELKIPFVSGLIGRTQGSSGDTGPHHSRAEGFPGFKDWPRWDSIAHQQVWEGFLKKAHDQGLNLLVASMVNFEPLCELMLERNKKYPDCSDSASLNLQLDAAARFERNHSWFKIVRSPSEAREAISKKQLAVILSLEASHIFGDGPWRRPFEEAYAKGVRTLQMVHQLNNRFGGAALHHPVFRAFSWYEDFKQHGQLWELINPLKFGFQYDRNPVDGTDYNREGLTNQGMDVIRELMLRGMPIDLAHLSENSVRGVRELTSPLHYPVYVSHGHFRKAMDDGKFSLYEKSSSDWVIHFIRESGGIFGLRTGPEKTSPQSNAGAPNDCQGSSKSFAQTYAYGRSRGVQTSFSTDMNGFIQQTRPRFGGERETCGAETDQTVRAAQQKLQKNPLGTRFDHAGLGSIGELPDLLQDLKNSGVDTRALEGSAEAFLKMWERALDASRQFTSRPNSSS